MLTVPAKHRTSKLIFWFISTPFCSSVCILLYILPFVVAYCCESYILPWPLCWTTPCQHIQTIACNLHWTLSDEKEISLMPTHNSSTPTLGTTEPKLETLNPSCNISSPACVTFPTPPLEASHCLPNPLFFIAPTPRALGSASRYFCALWWFCWKLTATRGLCAGVVSSLTTSSGTVTWRKKKREKLL